MAIEHALILHAGGLRSLVATALTLEQAERLRLTLLNIADGRTASARRLDHTHKQAEHFQVGRCHALDMPHLFGQDRPQAHAPEEPGQGVLVAPQLLLTALARARRIGAGRVVYPISPNGDEKTIMQRSEQIELATHLAQADVPDSGEAGASGGAAGGPSGGGVVQTPLLELTDQQVIELGTRLEAPWELAWSCWQGGQSPCRSCEGCRRRHNAFEAAGVTDPQAVV